ncbi:unnamed protein product [Linum tenue]|uniref:F-box domain-containing protein n=1 Tax=Linum tenue TaxID=586396 RepID=A0AAV0PDQ5_9ROSI|nr:unnamed protein product [Linum tenue]
MSSAGGQEDSTATGGNRRIDELHQVPNSSNEVVLESGPYLPSDAVMGILSKLPAKTLFRFKSVCTNWDAMVPSNPHLVSTHLRNYTRTSLLCTYRDLGNGGGGGEVPKSVLLHPDDNVDDSPRPIDWDDQLLDEAICGAGNGLILLGSPYRHHNPNYRLLNLATGQIRLLPNPSPGLKERRSDFPDHCGVGLDLAADDVKVVVIRSGARSHRDPPTTVFVYTWRSNLWRKLAPGSHSCGVVGTFTPAFDCHLHSNGFFYWLFSNDWKSGDSYVMAFDMSNDILHRIDCPLSGLGSLGGTSRGGGDSVALIPLYMDSADDMWLLSRDDDGGGAWCWIKQHSTGRHFPTTLVVRGLWKDDRIMTDLDDQLVLYDTVNHKYRVLVDKPPGRLHVYRERLSLSIAK